MPTLRVCRKCNLEANTQEDLELFRIDNNQPYGRQNICKECQSAYSKEWGRYAKYGITTKDYDRMLDEQDGKCAICDTNEPGGRFNTFHIDHCHTTGVVRGLLCSKCNHAIGLLNDCPTTIRTAANYVEFWKGGVPSLVN